MVWRQTVSHAGGINRHGIYETAFFHKKRRRFGFGVFIVSMGMEGYFVATGFLTDLIGSSRSALISAILAAISEMCILANSRMLSLFHY